MKKIFALSKEQQQRKEAMEWWNELIPVNKESIGKDYFKRSWTTLTGREIQFIYETEEKSKP